VRQTATPSVRRADLNAAVLFVDSNAGNCLAHAALLAWAGVHFSGHSRAEDTKHTLNPARQRASDKHRSGKPLPIPATGNRHEVAPVRSLGSGAIETIVKGFRASGGIGRTTWEMRTCRRRSRQN